MSPPTEKESEVSRYLDLKTLISPDILQIEEVMLSDLSSISEELEDLLVEILHYGLFNGGKRFRPLLAVLSARLSGRITPEIFHLAIAFEYLHVATLFHDDVIDNATTRRGKPAVSRVYGFSAAILAGDFLHARSMALVGEFGGVDALKIFCRATTGMVDGEFLQLRNAQNFNQSQDDYLEAITGKTVLLIAAALEVGSLLGGGNEEMRTALRSYGTRLGCAFQIIDDLLDYQGNQKNTGKVVGNDLAEGKMTLPLILALQRAGTKEKNRLLEILCDPEARKSQLAEVTEIISLNDGFVDARKQAERLVCLAIAELQLFRRPEQQKDRTVLEGLARYVLIRDK